MVKIGPIELPDFPLLLAPMEDVSDPPFRALCKEQGADVVYTEFISSEGLNINVLTIEPGICVMISGFSKTRETLEKSGVTVHTFDGSSLCIGCEGGPTCLTRPILRG